MIKNLKIIHCPTMVGGNPQGLCAAERRLGLNSWSLCFSPSYMNYPTDFFVFKDGASVFENEIHRWKWIFRILKEYDVIHYNFGETLAPSLLFNQNKKYPDWKIWLYNNFYARWFDLIDLRLARFLNKIIIVTYQGDDARQGDYCRKSYRIHFCYAVKETYYMPETDAYKRKRIKIFDRYANYIYAVNPDLLNVLPTRAKFIPYASVDLKDWCPKPKKEKSTRLHIVHAPSHRDVKGTDYILSAIQKLKSNGYDFDFTLVENVSNKQAREIYESADILIDQLLAGFYGALSVELMALGVPVICYMRDEDLHFLPNEMRQDIPIISATPETLCDRLEEMLLMNRETLQGLGEISRRFVEKWHNPENIVKMISSDVRAVIDRRAC